MLSGEPFDPERHEAVYQVTDAAHPAGTVAEVLQEGYLHHDRLLRPADGRRREKPRPPAARGLRRSLQTHPIRPGASVIQRAMPRSMAFRAATSTRAAARTRRPPAADRTNRRIRDNAEFA